MMRSDAPIRDDAASGHPDRVGEREPVHEAGPQHGGGRILFFAWLVLMALTVGSYALSDSGRVPGAGATPWLLSFAVLKSHLIAGIYMEMGHGPRVWLLLMSSFLFAEAALVWIVLP